MTFVPNQHHAGQAIFAEKLAERGYTLKEYVPHRQTHLVGAPDGGEFYMAHSYFLKSPPSVGVNPLSRSRNITRYKNGKRCFYVIGELPAWLPFKLWNHIERSDARVVADGLKIQSAVAAFKELLAAETPYENMNVMFNPQWIGPGRFVWGNIGAYAGTLTEGDL